MIYFTDKNDNPIPGLPNYIGINVKNQKIYVDKVYFVRATNHESEQCLEILGRYTFPGEVHTFVGDSAKEILLNWK